MTNYQGMPPPLGLTGRRGNPASGRGSRRGQGMTPKPRKPRANKLNVANEKAIFPNDVMAYQQQVIYQQQQQQQHQQHNLKQAVSATLGQFENSNSLTNNNGNNIGVTNSQITAPKVVVVSSAPPSVNVAAKPTQVAPSLTTTTTLTQVVRSNSIPVTSLSSSATTTFSTSSSAARFPNIPQVMFVNNEGEISRVVKSTSIGVAWI